MELNTLTRTRGLMRSRRVGRGGKRGKTSGRGGKGQTARAGNKRRPEWRDIIKKLPKRRGYGRNRSRTVVPYVPIASVSLDSISKKFPNGGAVTPIALVRAGLVRRIGGKVPPVKILGGEVFVKLDFKNISVSAPAKEAIEKAGGSIEKRETKS
ncbi:MAG: uL15 family ribosomal protein [bacterium]|nr:uL15 family ribosomal protein [bacterium]